MTDDISLLIKKIPKYIAFYPIMSHTKTTKLLLTKMRTKYNALILRNYIIKFVTL